MFKKSFFLLVVIHFSLLFIMVSILNLLRDECVAINNSSIASYDAGWYKDIAVNGYSIKESNQSNVAFFPLFPMLWRLSNTSNIGISLINLSIFLFSIFLIWRSYQLKVIELLLCLSIPSLFFCWVPFSEALFFFFSTILLVGLQKKQNGLFYLGIFGCCTTRAASLFFIPIILFTFFTLRNKNKFVKNSFITITLSLIALLLTTYIQYNDTGKWFAFLGQQQHWGHKFQLPSFPLTTWNGRDNLWLDATALLVSSIASIKCFQWVFLLLKKADEDHKKDYLFSIAYLGLFLPFMLFYFGNSMYSLNRYIFATPFFLLFLLYYLKEEKGIKKPLLCLLFIVLFWQLFGAYYGGDSKYQLDHFIYFLVLTMFISLFYYIKKYRFMMLALYLILTFMQAYAFSQYLTGKWVG